MKQEQEDGKRLNFLVSERTYEQVQAFCDDQSISLSNFLRQATESYLSHRAPENSVKAH